jgi:hypothetical protein
MASSLFAINFFGFMVCTKNSLNLKHRDSVEIANVVRHHDRRPAGNGRALWGR